MILSENDPVMVVGGGESESQDLRDYAALVSQIVAADGGAKALRCAGIDPDFVIGDMDSIGADEREAFANVLHPITEQITTDFEKCVSRIEARLIYALGFSGGRVDHLLSVLNVMARYPDKRIVLVGSQDISIVVWGELDLNLSVGTRVSIMPLEKLSCKTRGLRWNLNGEELGPLGLISISNETKDSEQHIFLSGLAVLSVPRSERDHLIESL